MSRTPATTRRCTSPDVVYLGAIGSGWGTAWVAGAA